MKTWKWMLTLVMFMYVSHAWAQEPASAPDGSPAEPVAPATETPAAAAPAEPEKAKPENAPAEKKDTEKKDAKSAEKKPGDSLKFKGDVRYRHEAIEKGDDEMDHRHRVRMRFGAFAEISRQMEVGFQVASGSGDPISTNQTLSPAFTKKPVSIDLAYFQYKPVEGLSLVGGKMKNPLFRPGDSQLIWDSDLTPEGLTLSYEVKFGTTKISALGLAYWNADRKGDEKDSHILGGQVRTHLEFGDFKVCVAGGFYDFTKIIGYGPIYEEKAFGNTLDAENHYINDYNIVDAGLELKGKAGSLPFAIFGQLAMNLAADEEKTGFLAGFSVGDSSKAMGWKLVYNFRSLQKDAVFGTYADSDFIGSSTGGAGHVVSAEFALTDNFLLGATVQRSTIDDGDDTAYTRIQVDASVKF